MTDLGAVQMTTEPGALSVLSHGGLSAAHDAVIPVIDLGTAGLVSTLGVEIVVLPSSTRRITAERLHVGEAAYSTALAEGFGVLPQRAGGREPRGTRRRRLACPS
jgi:hypothetical protein